MSIHAHAQAKATPKPAFTPAPTGLLQRKCACGGTPGPDGECAACRQKRLAMQRQAMPTHQTAPSTIPPIVHDVLRSSGQPLDAATRAFMEPRLGHDFSLVRVHTDARAAESAQAVNSLAYTVGRDVVFGTRQYEPGTNKGRRLLAHELAHVVQQSNSISSGEIFIASSNNRYEQEADFLARAVGQDSYSASNPGQLLVQTLQRQQTPGKGVTPEETAISEIAETRRQQEKFDEFQSFIHERSKRIAEVNETEARVQEAILKRCIDWVAAHQGKREFLRAKPLEVYERIGRSIITLDVERARLRAERAPQTDEAREQKLREFERLAQQLRNYSQRFPYLIPIPSQHRDILVEGHPAQQKAFDVLAKELMGWAIRNYWKGDFTIQSPTNVLSTLAHDHEAELRAADLEPLVFESFERTGLDPGIVARSFATTLGKVLLGAAIVGIVVGAEILTAGQVTWILVGLAGAMGAKAYHDRRQEIQATGIEVPKSETVIHAAGDVVGLSQLIEGATGIRLGTERRLGEVERSETLGEGAGNIAGFFVSSRAFRLGHSAGAAWRGSIPEAGTSAIGREQFGIERPTGEREFDVNVLKKLVIESWKKGGGNRPVKVVSIERGARPTVRGYITQEKFIRGRTPAEMEKILGLPPGELGKGAIVQELEGIPSEEQFTLRSYTQRPGGQAPIPGGKYPPGLGAPQWELLEGVPAKLSKTVGPGETFQPTQPK